MGIAANGRRMHPFQARLLDVEKDLKSRAARLMSA
jgi:hypothetical protein